MNSITKHIPNSITCLNLFSGCIACVYAFRGDFEMTALFIAFSAIFDYLDGMSARLLHAYSPMGKELDSLADMVSFGFTPGLIIYSLYNNMGFAESGCPYSQYIPYIAFLIPVFSGLRLAKFNIDERQSTSFVGLNTPSNAIFWIGVAFFSMSHPHYINVYTLTGCVIVFSYLLIAEIPMFSLKIKNLSWKDNCYQYILLIGTVILILCFGMSGLASVIGLYILLSLINNIKRNK